MSSLTDFEQAGYQFRQQNGQVMVQAPQRLLDENHIAHLRLHKADIERELVLREFIQLVRITAVCDHARLIHRDDIERELDIDSVSDLMQATREEKQAWAASLASRLTSSAPSGLRVAE